MDLAKSIRLAYQGTINMVECAYMLGVSILQENLRTVAAALISGTKNHEYKTVPVRRQQFERKHEEINLEESMAFIQGTGLNLVIEHYGLGVDPEEFRESFYEWCTYQKRRQESRLQSVSATTLAI